MPEAVLCDRFRLNELRDVIDGHVAVVPRITRWSEAAFDIRALRKLAKDGPLTVDPASRPLMMASLSVSMVKNDEQGSFRLLKRDPSHNTGRDDVAAALTLAAGAWARAPKRPKSGAYLGAA